jgi:hypothetical protein
MTVQAVAATFGRLKTTFGDMTGDCDAVAKALRSQDAADLGDAQIDSAAGDLLDTLATLSTDLGAAATDMTERLADIIGEFQYIDRFTAHELHNAATVDKCYVDQLVNGLPE